MNRSQIVKRLIWYDVKVFELNQKRQVDSVNIPQSPVSNGPQVPLRELEKDTHFRRHRSVPGHLAWRRGLPWIFFSTHQLLLSDMWDSRCLKPSEESQMRAFQQAVYSFSSLPTAEITETLPLFSINNYIVCGFRVRFHLKKQLLCLNIENV